MKWLLGWVIVFVVSWGLGAIVCGIAVWRKNYKVTKVAAVIFFGLPVVFLCANLIKQKMILNDFEYAKKEVARLCALDGGDKIYKTVDNVQGVFQMRLRQPESKGKEGNYNRWVSDQYGMEDPYGWAHYDRDDIAENVGRSSTLANISPRGKQGYWFIEQQSEHGTPAGSSYRRSYLIPLERPQDWQIRESHGNPLYEVKKKNVSQLRSRYGYLTEDLTTNEMRDHWIGAGRIKIVDLQTNEVLAERKGYFRASGDFLPTYGDRWHASFDCPGNRSSVMYFVNLVLRPPQDFPTLEQLELIAKD